jgi:GNAT superfamily N-acetyltransferase
MSAAALPFRSAPTLRATLDSVRDHLRAHYHRLGQASRRRRFMSQPSAATLDRIADQATPDLMLEIERDGAVRGLFEAYGTGQGHAEIALSVEDAYQGQGLGRELFEEGLRLLARRGFQTADLTCLRDNAAVLHMIRDAGGQIRIQDGEAMAAIELRRVLDQAREPG